LSQTRRCCLSATLFAMHGYEWCVSGWACSRSGIFAHLVPQKHSQCHSRGPIFICIIDLYHRNVIVENRLFKAETPHLRSSPAATFGRGMKQSLASPILFAWLGDSASALLRETDTRIVMCSPYVLCHHLPGVMNSVSFKCFFGHCVLVGLTPVVDCHSPVLVL